MDTIHISLENTHYLCENKDTGVDHLVVVSWRQTKFELRFWTAVIFFVHFNAMTMNEAVLWTSVGLFGSLFVLANQQLYVAPGWQSKDILRLRMGIAFALFLELLLPSLELLVRYVPAITSFIHMIPTLVFWVLLLVLSYALHKSIRVSREQDDKKWAIHLHRIWVMISMFKIEKRASHQRAGDYNQLCILCSQIKDALFPIYKVF